MDWIVANCDRGVSIFETGCGAGANLIWLGQHGFHSLAGRDNNVQAVTAARRLGELAGLPIDLAVDDCLSPTLPLPKLGLLIALDWLYLSREFQLNPFLNFYGTTLEPGGLVIFDMVHSIFNYYPNNRTRTDDWHLPSDQQRPTQYEVRMSEDEVRCAADMAGFDVINALPGTQVPPRFVWILKMRSPGWDNSRQSQLGAVLHSTSRQ